MQDNLPLTSGIGDKASEISKKIATKFWAFLILLGAVANLPKVLELAKFPLKPIIARSLIIGSLAVLSISVIVKLFKFFRLKWNAIKFAKENLRLLMLGNVAARDRLNEIHLLTKDVHLVTKFLQESTLFAKLVGLRPGVTFKYFILFSHKKENNANANTHHIGHGDRYRIPGFPIDEAECIIRLWSLAASSLNLSWADIQAQCSCTWDRTQEKARILGGSLAIVGSLKENAYAEELMNQLRRFEGNQINRQVRFYLEMDEKTDICYLNGDNKFGKKLMPDSTVGRNTGDRLIDFALLMKLPNLLADDSEKSSGLLLLAGCKAAGQVALTDWISEPSNVGDLISTYGNDPFQIAFKIKYEYVQDGVPIVLEPPQELYREKISVQPKTASAVASSK